MQQIKFIVVIGLIISCLADDMKKHQSNDTKSDQKTKDEKPATADSKSTKSTSSDDTSKPKPMDTKMTEAEMMLTIMLPPKMEDKPSQGSPSQSKTMTAQKDANGQSGQPKDDMDKSKDDMKVEASVGVGFYAGVAPISYGGYGGYPYSAYPYYRSYYARPYYAYPYKTIVPVIVKPRPVLLG